MKFSADDILDGAADAVAHHWRDATIAHVAGAIGAPVGSIYHRFGSRDELFGSLWLRSIRRFHRGLFEALDAPDPHDAAVEFALHIPRFSRDHPGDARAMTLYSQAELLASAPAALTDQITEVNDRVRAGLLRLERRLWPADPREHTELLTLACIESPYGIVRQYLRAGRPIPIWLDDVVRVSTLAILQLVSVD